MYFLVPRKGFLAVDVNDYFSYTPNADKIFWDDS